MCIRDRFKAYAPVTKEKLWENLKYFLEALMAVSYTHLFHDLVGARGDLVDHGPGEGDLALVRQVVDEVLADIRCV